MKESRILIVEDDRSIMNLISTTLKLNQYEYVCASGGKEAVSQCASYAPALILLDLGLPDMDGIDVIRTVRTWSQVPIIVISARGEDSDKIEALDNGADDYLTKPFSVDEMMARIRAALRRSIQLASGTSESIYRNGDLFIDYAASIVKRGEREIHLTPIEYKLLCLLSRNTGKVLTHSYIIQHIWGSTMETDIVSLRVYMTSLRRKLNQDESEEALIRTHVGIGYQMIRAEE